MARKSLFVSLEHQLKKVKNEFEAARKVGSRCHISKLVGAYLYVDPHTEGDIYNILSFPIANCNLDEFSDACDAILDREPSEFRECWTQSWRRFTNATSIEKTSDRMTAGKEDGRIQRTLAAELAATYSSPGVWRKAHRKSFYRTRSGTVLERKCTRDLERRRD